MSAFVAGAELASLRMRNKGNRIKGIRHEFRLDNVPECGPPEPFTIVNPLMFDNFDSPVVA